MKRIFNNRISKAVRAIIVLSALIYSINSSLAQTVAGYTFSSSAGTYTAISGGTVLITGTSSMDSWVSSAVTIPSFTFACTAYTTVYVTSNGQLSLGGSAPSAYTYTGVSSGVGSGICICPFSADLNRVNSTAATEIRWQTVGSEVVFQWTQMCRYGVTENFDFQVRLNTTTNVIKFVYRLNSGPGSSTSYQPEVGIRTSATDYKNIQISTGAETWAAPLAGTANTNTCRFTSTAVAKSFTTGRTYTWTPPASCSGTPAPGNTLASSNPACSGVPFTLSMSGSAAGCGITYQWQSSPDNVTWTNIAGATSATYSASQTTATYYRCLVTCTNGGASTYSTFVYVTMNSPSNCYCINTNTTNTSYYISNFTATGTTTINNTTGFATNGYIYYSALSVTQMQSQTVTFSITETGGTMHFGIWVDWNDDGDFSDSGEEVYYNGTYNSTVSGSFTVPVTAPVGCHRMRVVGNESGTVDVCTGTGYTECEDYQLCVTALPNCSGSPSAGTATISSASGCLATNFNLSATGLTTASGITYQWQSGTSATGPWTNIAGANSSTLTTSASVTTWYRLVTTCANSGLSNNTNVVSYTVVGDICTCGAYPSNYASSTADEDIGNVTVGTLNNSSALGAVAGGSGSVAFRYSNYAGIVGAPNLQQLATTNFSLSSLTTGSSYNNGFQVYIDYNQDGDFADAGEQVYNSAASTSGPHTETGSFVVPLSATLGITRMRVICVETTFPSATNYSSSAYSYGETEDYCVNITAAPPCSGTPTGGTTTASSTACGHIGAISVTGSTGASGLTYQWYSSPTGGAPWTLIPGATGATYTPAVSGLYYQRVITCTASGSSATSSSLQYITTAPSNDECVNAIPLTVNAGTTCTVVTAGTVQCASASSQSNSCSGTADDDVWFSFVATNTSHTISLLNVAGSTTDMYHSIYSGTCGALTNIKCNDADNSTITGLTIGDTYYVRVYTYTSTAGQTTTFNICVGTSNVVSVVGSSTCENAVAFCASNDSPGVDFEITDDAVAYPAGQCTFMKNPSWWYMQISQDGDLDMTIASSCGDVDFACYGPFTNLTCLPADLTNPSPSLYFNDATLHVTYNPTSEPTYSSTDVPFCEVATLAQPSGNLVDFGGDIDAVEYLQIRNAVVGQYYIVLIGNYAQCAGTVSFNQTNFGAGGAGAVDCDIVTQCNITSITATTTVTGATYTVSGNINFIDPPASGTLTICDGAICQTFTAPFTSPQAYSLTGLTPDGLQHQLTATFTSPTVNCSKISNYTSPPNLLPVELLSFNAKCNNPSANIYWQTSSETNNDYFVIEKRNVENAFHEIGRVKGAGNSNSVLDYHFVDENLLPGDNFYRLLQVDYDGKTTIYSTINLNCDNYTAVSPILQAFPNPFKDEVNVIIKDLDEGEFTLEVINELGKVVYHENYIANGAEFRTLLNLHSIPPAVYNLRCSSKKNILNIRVVKE